MTLRTYIIRRGLLLIPTFFISTLLIFSLIHLAPGDPVEIMFAEMGRPVPPELKESVRKSLGLDKPLYTQYFIWLSKLCQGDFGVTFSGAWVGQQVIDIILGRLPLTLELMLTAQIVAIFLAVFLGAVAAVKQYKFFDNIASVGALLGYSMPSFWLAMILLLVFGLRLGWLPIFGARTPGVDLSPFQTIIDNIRHLILPATVVAIGSLAYYFRIVRNSMLEILQQEYITTARSKGLKEMVVIYKHALKNALLPLVTVVGISLGYVLTGSVVVETIFAWPGIGQLVVIFATRRDYSALMATSTLLVWMVILANLLTDISYAFLDPRIKY